MIKHFWKNLSRQTKAAIIAAGITTVMILIYMLSPLLGVAITFIGVVAAVAYANVN